jgi:hypothetical protein
MAMKKYSINSGTLLQAIQAAKYSVVVVMNVCNQSDIPEAEHDELISRIFSETSLMLIGINAMETEIDELNIREIQDNFTLMIELFDDTDTQD